MISKFLPAEFNPSRPLAVLAGRGVYPWLTVQAIRHYHLPLRLIGFEEETRTDLIQSFEPKHRCIIKVGQLGRLLRSLAKWQAAYAIMVGQITPRRLFDGIHPDWRTLRMLARLKERNAETLFGAVAEAIEQKGVEMLDARAFLEDALAEHGVISGGKLEVAESWIQHGMRMAKSIASLDIGQGVVVRKGTVLAVEAFEGTDAMLRRCQMFKTKGMVFVKVTKPNQDYRFDVPCFGLRTLESMQKAGISLACLEANKILILERDKVLQRAKEWGIQLVGIEPRSC